MSTAVSRAPTTRFGQQNWHDWQPKNDTMIKSYASNDTGGTPGPAAVTTKNTVAVDLFKKYCLRYFGGSLITGGPAWPGAFLL